MKFHMLMLMNKWMMFFLMQMQMQSASLTLGCYIKAHLGTDHTKGVVNQGVGAPQVWPHHYHRLSGPRSSGGCMPPCNDGSKWFPYFLAPNRPSHQYKQMRCSPFNTHTIWSYTPHLSLLVLSQFQQQYFGASKAIKEGLASWKKSDILV